MTMTYDEYQERVQNNQQLDSFHRCEMRCYHDIVVEELEQSRQLFGKAKPSLQESEHRRHLYEWCHTTQEKKKPPDLRLKLKVGRLYFGCIEKFIMCMNLANSMVNMISFLDNIYTLWCKTRHLCLTIYKRL